LLIQLPIFLSTKIYFFLLLTLIPPHQDVLILSLNPYSSINNIPPHQDLLFLPPFTLTPTVNNLPQHQNLLLPPINPYSSSPRFTSFVPYTYNNNLPPNQDLLLSSLNPYSSSPRFNVFIP
jgi:hypothetical protein